MDYETTIEIDAPAEKVWEAMVDVDRWPEMSASITSVERVDGAELAPGTRVRIKQPGMLSMQWEVTALDPGRSFVWQARTPGVLTVGSHAIRQTATGTAAMLGIVHSGPLAPVVRRITAARTRRYVTMEARGLKQRSEDRAPSAQPGA